MQPCTTCKFCDSTEEGHAKCSRYKDPFNGAPLLIRIARADYNRALGYAAGSLCGYEGVGWTAKPS